MGTQATPEPQLTPQVDDQNQPIPQPAPSGPTLEQIFAGISQNLEKQEQNQRFILQQLSGLQTQRPSEPYTPPPPPPTYDDFQNDPKGFVSNVVKESLVPFMQQFTPMLRNQQIEQVINFVLTSPGYEDVKEFTPQFRQLLSGVQDLTNMQAVTAAYFAAKGQYFHNKPQVPVNTPANPTPPNRSYLPPHLQPSGPVPQPHNPSNLPNLRPLNENEERLRKEWGMSHHKFLFRGKEITREIFDAYENKGKK